MSPTLLSLRDLSSHHARLELQGPDALRFLHGMVTNDIKSLRPGQGCHACLLTVKGKLVGNLWVHCTAADRLLIDLPVAAKAGVMASLDRHLIMDNAVLREVSAEIAQLGVYGTQAAQALDELLPGPLDGTLSTLPQAHHRRVQGSGEELLIAAAQPLGIAGFHVLGRAAALNELHARLLAMGGLRLLDEAAEVLRVEAGIPLYGRDLDEERMPTEAGLFDAISHTKGCYLGQETVVRLRDRGSLNRRLCGLRFMEGGAPPPSGSKLRTATRPLAGSLTSAVQSSRFGTIALGYLHKTCWEPGTEVELLTLDEQPTGRLAVICDLPFIDT